MMPMRSLSVGKVRRLAVLHTAESFPPISGLAKILSLSRTTTREYRRRIQESGYSFAEFAALRPKEMRLVLKQATCEAPPERYTTLLSIFPEIERRMYEGRANLKESWTEYKKCHLHGYGYSQFTVHFRAWQRAQELRTTSCSKWRVAHVSEGDVAELKKWRRSNDRIKWAKAVVILDLHQGTAITSLCSKLEKSARVVKRWFNAYMEKGLELIRK